MKIARKVALSRSLRFNFKGSAASRSPISGNDPRAIGYGAALCFPLRLPQKSSRRWSDFSARRLKYLANKDGSEELVFVIGTGRSEMVLLVKATTASEGHSA